MPKRQSVGRQPGINTDRRHIIFTRFCPLSYQLTPILSNYRRSCRPAERSRFPDTIPLHTSVLVSLRAFPASRPHNSERSRYPAERSRLLPFHPRAFSRSYRAFSVPSVIFTRGRSRGPTERSRFPPLFRRERSRVDTGRSRAPTIPERRYTGVPVIVPPTRAFPWLTGCSRAPLLLPPPTQSRPTETRARTWPK